MINGLYTATAGMAMQQRRVDVVASNLANINTTGHKKEIAVFSQYLPNATETPNDFIRNSEYNKTINSKVRLHDIKTSFEMGYLKETGKSLDMALGNPKAFFPVDTPFGVRFTRDGAFTLNDQNELITMDGYKLVSNVESLQAVRLPEDAVITETGDILVDGAQVGAIDIVEFESMENIQKQGRNLYVAVDTLPVPSEQPKLYTGYLEGSNVNPIDEMVKMIEASRGFENYSKIIHTIQEMDSKAAGEVGKVS